MSEIACPHCHYVSQNGVKVCIGCQAEVVYGSTSSEIKTAMLFGGIGASILSSIMETLDSSDVTLTISTVDAC